MPPVHVDAGGKFHVRAANVAAGYQNEALRLKPNIV